MTKVFDTKTISKEFDDITNSYYKQGYEDAINKACDLLRDLDVFTEDFINDFRKAMRVRYDTTVRCTNLRS